MKIPDRLYVGVPCARGAKLENGMLAEIGGDYADLPDAKTLRKELGDRSLTMIGWFVMTHRRTDPRYKQMKSPPPEHAAVGHFERSRWTDEAWEHTDKVARALDVQAAVLQTPPSFKATAEHALRLENFIAHAMRPGLALAWEWAAGSWPERKALELCDRIGAIPVIDPTQSPIPEAEYVYLRFRGGAKGKKALKDDDLKQAALAVRDRIGWVLFSNAGGAEDAKRFTDMI
ncbi:MAG TPA: hypothetical protein VM600_01790 [Actinomycetota bacterium]|nr:hypothetical protein [Actinomycetota bacterium]